jgi:hypothetical protein
MVLPPNLSPPDMGEERDSRHATRHLGETKPQLALASCGSGIRADPRSAPARRSVGLRPQRVARNVTPASQPVKLTALLVLGLTTLPRSRRKIGTSDMRSFTGSS